MPRVIHLPGALKSSRDFCMHIPNAWTRMSQRLGIAETYAWFGLLTARQLDFESEHFRSCMVFSDLASEVMQHHFTTSYQYWITLNLIRSMRFVGLPRNVNLGCRTILGMLLVYGYNFWGQPPSCSACSTQHQGNFLVDHW